MSCMRSHFRSTTSDPSFSSGVLHLLVESRAIRLSQGDARTERVPAVEATVMSDQYRNSVLDDLQRFS